MLYRSIQKTGMRVIGTEKNDSHLMVYQCHALVAKLINEYISYVCLEYNKNMNFVQRQT